MADSEMVERTFAYEFDVPVPDIKSTSRQSTERMRIAEGMPVGASYLFEKTNQNQMTQTLTKIKKRSGKRFVCRTVMLKGEKAVRVWRIPEDEDPPAFGQTANNRAALDPHPPANGRDR